MLYIGCCILDVHLRRFGTIEYERGYVLLNQYSNLRHLRFPPSRLAAWHNKISAFLQGVTTGLRKPSCQLQHHTADSSPVHFQDGPSRSEQPFDEITDNLSNSKPQPSRVHIRLDATSINGMYSRMYASFLKSHLGSNLPTPGPPPISQSLLLSHPRANPRRIT
jgi:hypothetical protein